MYADFVLSGGAAGIVEIMAAANAIYRRYTPRRLLGTSSGGIKALLDGFQVAPFVQEKIVKEAVQKNRLLDFSISAKLQYALVKWEYLPEVCDKVLGPKTTLGEAKIPVGVVVTDAYESRPVIMSSWDTPQVLVREALRATTALVPLAPMVTVPSFGRGNRLYYDGGFTANFAMDAFDDDHLVPTIGIRLRSDKRDVRPIRDVKSRVMSVVRSLLYSSDHAWLSAKNSMRVCSIDSPYDGLNFDQSHAEFSARIQCGAMAGHKFVAEGVVQ
jgi:predicted acylesterase/phospholipase RssA